MPHDMGKLGIPQQMLDKRGRLDDNEFSVVMSMISAQSGTQFDPVVVAAFLEIIEAHGGVDNLDWIGNQASDQPLGAVAGARVGGPLPGKVS